MHPPTIHDDLKGVVLKALDMPYISVSCKDRVETGNHYQSVVLDGLDTAGFRTRRDGFFDLVDFTGKKVLDLGSNLGELSRAARARGASLVDGFEYDPFFVEIANGLNAVNGTTRVSFFQRDITDRATYVESYDIVLAFAVSHYVNPVLEVITGITDGLLIVETHRLQGNLEGHYISPVTAYLPAYRLLGYSDWSTTGGADDRRAVVAFARDEVALQSGLRTGGELAQRSL